VQIHKTDYSEEAKREEMDLLMCSITWPDIWQNLNLIYKLVQYFKYNNRDVNAQNKSCSLKTLIIQ